ncbi:hypothetical protein ACQ4M3_39440 [Leptolyngbya sp. AN03gr2]|uniref:hypothetical protein n=1 Tax=unclassified Leptolyngbya TaxID=2650499 RepID=UPI003D31E043
MSDKKRITPHPEVPELSEEERQNFALACAFVKFRVADPNVRPGHFPEDQRKNLVIAKLSVDSQRRYAKKIADELDAAAYGLFNLTQVVEGDYQLPNTIDLLDLCFDLPASEPKEEVCFGEYKSRTTGLTHTVWKVGIGSNAKWQTRNHAGKSRNYKRFDLLPSAAQMIVNNK